MAENEKNSEDGPSSASDRFVRLLSEIESAGLEGRALSADLEGPLFSRAVFGCVIRIGVGDESR